MSSSTVYGLNEDDRAWFLRLVDWFKARKPERPTPVHRGPVGGDEWMTVVLTPVTGIPAMWEEVAGTGTGSKGNSTAGTGTGTGIGDAGDRPGFADCDEYLLAHGTPGGKYLARPRMEKTGRTITVYNVRFTAINGNQFITVLRDRLGDWWVPENGDLFTACS